MLENKKHTKPYWIRSVIPNDSTVKHLKIRLRQHRLHTVCEEASCPNLTECFSQGTASFMIMGKICTRLCSFCDVSHGQPMPLDSQEPENLAKTIAEMNLQYVVITSVNRDDVRDGGASHFVQCIQAIRALSPKTRIETLVPDFRRRVDKALIAFEKFPPDVFSHNLETVPRLYATVRAGANYEESLMLLKRFKLQHEGCVTKSGLMLGLGETAEEVEKTLLDLRNHDCDALTVGQYLQPSRQHFPVFRYVLPSEFQSLANTARKMGFQYVNSAPMVRSSYHAADIFNR
jgi:lipoic acid synthetase